MQSSQPNETDDEIYDDEAYIGVEEGQVTDGRVVDDLDDEDAEDFEDDDEDDDGDYNDFNTNKDDKESGDAGSEQAHDAESTPETVLDNSIQQFTRHSDAVMAVAWNPSDSTTIASGGCDDTAYVWSLGVQESEAVRITGHEDTVSCVAFDPAGRTLATGGLDGAIRLWDVSSRSSLGDLQGPTEGIEWLHWHPKGTILLAGSEDFSAWMFNASQQQCMQVFSGHSGPVAAGGFTPDGRAIVTAGGDGDGSLRIWNPKTGTCTTTVAAGHGFHDEQGITCLAFSSDGANVATGGVDGSVIITSLSAGRSVMKIEEHSDSVEGVAFSNGLLLVVSVSMDKKACIWDMQADAVRGVCKHPEGVVGVSMQHEGSLFATACLDGVTRIFDVRTAQCVLQLGGHTAPVQCLQWSFDDAYLATGSDDQTLRVYKMAS